MAEQSKLIHVTEDTASVPPRKQITGKLTGTDPTLLPAKKRGKGLRYVGNGLIIVGVLLMLGVLGFQGYYWWLESSTPDVQELAGVPTQVYLSPGSNLPATVTPVTQANAATSATPASGSNVASNASLPSIDSGQQGSAGSRGNVPTTPPVRIVIPSIKLDSKIVDIGWHVGKDQASGKDVAIWDVAEYAVGHHQGTANPGMIGNVVLSGHDDYKGEVFRYLNEAKLGDEVRLYNQQGDEYLYVVTQITKVKEEGVKLEDRIHNAEYMNPTPDQTLTMITCWPYAVDSYRWIVIAKPYNSLGNTAAGEPQIK